MAMLTRLFLKISILCLCLPSYAQAETCAGYPLAKFKSLKEGKCLGLVANKKTAKWKTPRKVLALGNQLFAVTDFGGWQTADKDGIIPRRGKLWLYDAKNGSSIEMYSNGLYSHGLALDSFGRILVGDADAIVRFDRIGAASDVKRKVLVNKLPTAGLHPMTNFIVLKNNDLIVNIGASSDDCKKEMNLKGGCFARDNGEAELRRYFYNESTDKYFAKFQVIAKGLRNSMALVQSPYDLGVLFQAENSMDKKGTIEELNQIPLLNVGPGPADNFGSEPTDYGWPYCSGKKSFMNNYANFCANQNNVINKNNAPLFAIPSHSSPLDMTYYSGAAHSDLAGTLLMTWHGWRRSKNHDFALVSYRFSKDGTPLADYEPLIQGQARGKKFQPVGVTTDSEGLIYLVDDKSGDLYVYADGDSGANGADEALPSEYVDQMSKSALKKFQLIYEGFKTATERSCSGCHGEDNFPEDSTEALRSFLDNGWILKGSPTEEMKLFIRLSGSDPDLLAMPPAGPFKGSNPELYKIFEKWVGTYISP